MPVIIGWLIAALATAAGELLIRAIVGAGIGFATYEVGSAAVGVVRGYIGDRFASLGEIAGYIGFLKIDVAITIVLSAWVGRMAVSAGKAFLVKKKAS